MQPSFSVRRSSPTRLLTVLAIFLAVTFIAALIGTVFTLPSIPTWYETLVKPAWTPANGAFGPVWSVLYLLMAVAAWLVWRAAGWHRARGALTLYFGQLALNAAWSVLFFGAHLVLPALIEILVLAVLILATLVAFSRHSRGAALLLVPYLIWVCYAASLNAGIWVLNP